MRDFANPCSVLTKSPLLLRDIELFSELVERDRVHGEPLGADARREGLARDRAAHPHPRKRLEAVAELNRTGIPSSVLIAPLMPGRQRLARAGRADPRAGRRGGGAQRRRRSGCTFAARCARSSSTGCASTGPTCSSATRSCTAAAPTCRAPSVSDWRTWRGAARGFAAPGASASEKPTTRPLERPSAHHRSGRPASSERQGRCG